MHTSMNWKYETIISADSAHRFPYSIFWGVSMISILGKAGYAPHFKCAPCSPHNDSPFYRMKPGGEAWNPLKSRCFLFAWTFSDRGSPIVKSGMISTTNLLTWFWFVGVSTALSLSFHPVFCCLTSQADYVELEQLKIQVKPWEKKIVQWRTLPPWSLSRLHLLVPFWASTIY